MTEAVIFDLDGVLLDSEEVWDRARRQVAVANGGHWLPGATEAMQGMSSTEWSAYLHQELGVRLAPAQIVDAVVTRLLEYYGENLPMLPGAQDAVRRIGRHWPLGLASSSNRVVIEKVLERAGLQDCFRVTVSSEEVPRGKPAPDVYLEAARQLGVSPPQCCAVEDSANGIRSAVAAEMTVIAIPNQHFPPPQEVLAQANLVLPGLDRLTVEAVEQAGSS